MTTMDLNQVPIDQMVNGVVNMELGSSGIKLIETEPKCREIEETKLALELEIRNKDKDLEAIKDKIRVLEGEKLQIEVEIKGLKKKRSVLQGAQGGEMMGGDSGEVLLDGPDTEIEGVSKWIVENKVLECEKNSALKEVEVWKQKCKELESRVVELEGKLKSQGKDGSSIGIKGVNRMNGDAVGTSRHFGTRSRLPGSIDGAMLMKGTPGKRYVPAVNLITKVLEKRRMACRGERSGEKIAPLTPAGEEPSSAAVIDIVDGDNECDVNARHWSNSQGEESCWMMSEFGDEADRITDGEIDRRNTAFILTPKSKRMRDVMVVTSDDDCEVHECKPSKRTLKIENSDNEAEDDDTKYGITIRSLVLNDDDDDDDDDDIFISQLKRKRGQGSSKPTTTLNPTRPRRRLVKYKQDKPEGRDQEVGSHPDTLMTTGNVVDDDESSEDESQSSVKSLGSFIVDDDEDVEIGAIEEDGAGDSVEQDETSDSDMDYGEIISKLKGRKDPNSKWTQEADMLSDFGKKPELCMRAVCALYRRQTNEEKECKASIIYNGRGFSRADATSGTRLGEFLTDGDPKGDMVKSVEELKEYDRDGLEECHRLAWHYSKQLFSIYESGEDRFFT